MWTNMGHHSENLKFKSALKHLQQNFYNSILHSVSKACNVCSAGGFAEQCVH